MTIRSLSLAAAAAVLLAGTANAKPMPKGCASASTAQIESQFAKFNNAWATKSPSTVTALFAKDAVLLATLSNKPRTNHTEIEDYFVGFLKKSPVGAINSSTIKIDCNTASRVGTWTVSLTDPATGTTTDVKARYSFIYSYEGGQWKIAHLHSSVMPEPIA